VFIESLDSLSRSLCTNTAIDELKLIETGWCWPLISSGVTKKKRNVVLQEIFFDYFEEDKRSDLKGPNGLKGVGKSISGFD
jgi:hypothetical protein